MTAVASVAALAIAGCASSGARDGAVRARTASTTPWIVPREENASQRLFRARLDSTEGRGRFRLLLRLHDPTRYQIRATHPLFNRRLWSLDVDGASAVLVDHHQHTVCRYRDEAEIGAIPLGPFPFASLPALLLGYLPLPPAGEPTRPAPDVLAYEDAVGRRWTAKLERGGVESWEVDTEESGTVTFAKGAGAGDGSGWDVLAAEAERLDLRWRETLREDLVEPMSTLEVPADYADGQCDLGWLRAVEDAPWEEEERDPPRR